MRIGLFGGSFNPPHEGHRLVAATALKRLELDRIWWIVTPGNPLKDNRGLPPLADRMRATARLARHPRMAITGLEQQFGSRYTFDTVDTLLRRCAGVRFVWIMGADNLAGFHRWQHWREIAHAVPIAIIDRPDATLIATRSRAGHVLANRRMHEADAVLLPNMEPPAWVFFHGPRTPLSSTALRAAAGR
jgi:nicotinate-nucleotide adenylyltransferase